MSLGRPAKMFNQRRFGSTILAPSACHTQKPLLEASLLTSREAPVTVSMTGVALIAFIACMKHPGQ